MKHSLLKSLFYGLLIISLCLFAAKIYYHECELRELILHNKGIKPVTPVIEKLVSSQQSWSGLQCKVKDAVVQIFAQKAIPDLLQPFKTPAQYQSTGSGFFINENGEIITNAHVVDQAKSVWIQVPSLGKRQIDVEVVGVSPDRDLALLRIKKDELESFTKDLNGIKYLPLGNSDLVHRADEIMTLGYPLGQQGLKSTTGIVSGREQHLIQIDAAINPGNSGGPSLNLKGEVIGINTLYAPDAQNVGYIIPINELKIVLNDLRTFKLLKRPYLGILFNNASEALTEFLGNPPPGGVYVVEVYKDSPLQKAGIQKRDMIYQINGHTLDVYGELLWNEDRISIIDYVSQLKLGQEISLVVYRQGKQIDLKFLFNQPDLLPIHKIYPGYETLDYEIVAGMVVQPLTTNHLPLLVNIAPGLTRYAEMKHQMKPALIITHIFPDSQAQRCRSLLPGAILSEINGLKVSTIDSFRTALFESIKTGRLSIETTDSVFVVLPFKRVIEEDQRLAKDYFYPLTQGVQSLVNTLDKIKIEHEKKSSDNANTNESLKKDSEIDKTLHEPIKFVKAEITGKEEDVYGS